MPVEVVLLHGTPSSTRQLSFVKKCQDQHQLDTAQRCNRVLSHEVHCVPFKWL